jgi:hypothetical protein
LEKLGVLVIPDFTNSEKFITNWLNEDAALHIEYPDKTFSVLQRVLKID